MSKIKTKKSAAKRFKITKTGKILRRQAFTSHLNVKRSSKKRRKQNRPVEVTGSYAKRLLKALGIKKK
ncbi:MAG: 50S ribosomal protein L35 [Candidatus Nitrosomaritimum yanchengensis]